MLWRNGGGMTTEIAVEPGPGASPERPFLWRVSIADVGADGPFSAFPGYDRTILLLSGNGMRLDAGEHGSIDLTRPFEPQRFSGDWPVDGRLVDGPVRDFNLMVDRSRAEGSIEVLRAMDVMLAPGEAALLHVLDGRVACGGLEIQAQETMILDGGAYSFHPEPGTVAVLARIRRVG